MKLAYLILSLLILTIIVLVIHVLYVYANDSPYRISSEQAKRSIESGDIDVILDVRTKIERTTLGFYPGSVHIQSADLDKIMPIRYPNKDLRIIAYCNTGQRARAAIDKLHALGYKNAVYISSTYKDLL
jgi:rhodanese-related sulfurtransferase